MLGYADLRALLASAAGQGPVWTHLGPELNVNLLVWPAGAGVAEHVNHEVEVLLVGVEGEGLVTVAGEEQEIRPGVLVAIPPGAHRAIQSRSPRFAYLSIHRRRAG